MKTNETTPQPVAVQKELALNIKDTIDCLTISQIARKLGVSVKDLNAELVDKGVQVWKKGQFRLTPTYEERDYAKNRLFIYYSKDGEPKKRTYLVWTPKGAEFIKQFIKKVKRQWKH